jgi:ABC-type sugar transport system ATPase subunit
LLDATEVNHRYGGVAVLAGVSVHVAEGTVVALRRLEDNAGRRHAI